MTAVAILDAARRSSPRSPVIAALDEHRAACETCRAVTGAGLPSRFMCAAGATLVRFAVRLRGRRR